MEECGVREVAWVNDIYKKKSSWATTYISGRFFTGIRISSRCESIHAKLGRFVERRYDIFEFVMNFQCCVDFLRDNEEELNFRSSYGTPVLQMQFPELEKFGTMNFTKEIFSRYRESFKRCVRVTILECIEREEGCIYVTQKYHRPQMRMESFGLPYVHILAILVGVFLQHCKRFAKVTSVREEDFRHYVEKVVRDTHMLEKRSFLKFHGVETSNIIG
ncbi:hypothetical protein Ahy_B07g086572 [Arachis hypogaea]|uniref:Protein FAR1-RELATED SEQUENCE n=1 Tax=Arachis hypogaea TaxID=3818 RepID=A0A444Y9Z5_ARAHY|nr:hypothetical protein Ahy_B07g086572 [Arachis hypogaea]